MSEVIARKDLIEFRPGVPVDKNFIYSTWLRGLYYGNSYYHQIESEIYFTAYNHMLDALFALPTTEVQVACLKEDNDVILGYSVCDPMRLHWLFVKPVWRGIGLARHLIPERIVSFTHLTTAGEAVWKKKFPHLKFNPFMNEPKEKEDV